MDKVGGGLRDELLQLRLHQTQAGAFHHGPIHLIGEPEQDLVFLVELRHVHGVAFADPMQEGHFHATIIAEFQSLIYWIPSLTVAAPKWGHGRRRWYGG